jgi:hypothetical protein
MGREGGVGVNKSLSSLNTVLRVVSSSLSSSPFLPQKPTRGKGGGDDGLFLLLALVRAVAKDKPLERVVDTEPPVPVLVEVRVSTDVVIVVVVKVVVAEPVSTVVASRSTKMGVRDLDVVVVVVVAVNIIFAAAEEAVAAAAGDEATADDAGGVVTPTTGLLLLSSFLDKCWNRRDEEA